MKTQKKILLVDDDAEFTEEIKEILLGEGYQVSSVSDSLTAEKLFNGNNNNKFDILLLDFKIGPFGGDELLKRIKDKIGKCRVILISGRPAAEKIFEKEGLDVFLSGFFSKPFDVSKLIDKIRSFDSSS